MSNPSQFGAVTPLSLLNRLRASEQEAWKQFVHLYGPLLEGWCRRLQVPAQDVADICQEVYRRVAGAIGEFRPSGQRGAFRAWLRTITRHVVLEQHRRTAFQPVGVGGSAALAQFQELPDWAEDAEEASAVVQLVRRTLELIRPEFNESTWQAFEQVSLTDHAPDEVASRLGLSVYAVRQACYRVRRRLRQELKDLED